MHSRNLQSLAAFLARCVVAGLAAAFVLSVLAPGLVGRLRGTPAGGTAPRASTAGPVSYADAVAHASPSVVNIYANRVTVTRPAYAVSDPFNQRVLGYAIGPARQRRYQNLGSGVIFSADGYVLTNNHVIAGADDIQVLLDDGSVAQAQVTGTDAETDLAVLKIDGTDLPAIDIADGGDADVGDVVLAIGNPAGFGKTVTMGIVSATGRQLNLSRYEDFIQTDAAINAGNSGGALVNARGELIGINTAVYNTPISAGAGKAPEMPEGIGFAIPVATAKAVLDQIIKHGHVIRGWIGADYTDIPAPRGASVRQPGVLVSRVVPDSPAAQAKLQPGDILLRIDGAVIANEADLLNREAAFAPGTKVRVEGLRGNQPFSLDVVLAQRPAPSTTGA